MVRYTSGKERQRTGWREGQKQSNHIRAYLREKSGNITAEGQIEVGEIRGLKKKDKMCMETARKMKSAMNFIYLGQTPMYKRV